MSLATSPFWMSSSAGAAGASTGQSLRFDDGDGAYLTWTPSSAGNRKTWTWSSWVKRGNLGSYQSLFGAGTTSPAYSEVRFSSSDTLEFYASGGTSYYFQTSSVYRDVGAWYHIVIAQDTTQATSTDRVKIYVNGEQVTSFSSSTYPSQNSEWEINYTYPHGIGSRPVNGTFDLPMDGYQSNVCFIDGTALDPTSFGEYGSGTTLWQPKSDTNIQALTFGTNGFYLPFKQTTSAEGFSAVTYEGNSARQGVEGLGFQPDLLWIKYREGSASHTLFDSIRGVEYALFSNTTNADYSYAGVGLDSFDTDGFSVTHNSGNNQFNVSGRNYIAWAWNAGENSAPTGYQAINYIGTGANRRIHGLGFEPDLVWIKRRDGAVSHNLFDSVRTDANGMPARLYSNLTNAEEPSIYSTETGNVQAFNSDGFDLGNGGNTNTQGGEYVAWCWDAGTGSPVSNEDGSITSTVKADATKGFSIVSYTGGGSSGDTVGHGLSSAPEMIIVKNRDATNNWPVYHTAIGNTKSIFLNKTDASSTLTYWNSTSPDSSVFTLGNNLIVNQSGVDFIAYCFHSVSGYSKVGSYSGTGVAGNSVTGLGFKPAWLMIKNTSLSGSPWVIYDNTREPTNYKNDVVLQADNSAAEIDGGGTARAVTFDDDGFTLETTYGGNNGSGYTYMYMAFAGGQDLITPENTDGSITSRVKANTEKGFSMVSYTGTGANATVGHGLDSAPEMLIIKNRDASSKSWGVWHSAIANTEYLTLQTTNAKSTYAPFLNSTSPTSSVVSLGSWGDTNGSGNRHIMYCFHSVSGYSSIGSYTGNGLSGSSGPTINCGFKPAFVLIKCTSTGSTNWAMLDNTRSVDNSDIDDQLFANLSNAEYVGYNFGEFTSTGFQITDNSSGLQGNYNTSGATYLYIAFADTRDATFFGDTSGNDNNWTPTNLNNTDVVLDGPYNGGNFATNLFTDTNAQTYSEGNLKLYYTSTTTWQTTRATMGVSSGKWYWEHFAGGSTYHMIGIVSDSFIPLNGSNNYTGSTSDSYGYISSTGNVYNNATGSAYGDSYAAGDIIGVALDLDAGTLTFYKNGISQGTAATGLTGTWIPAHGTRNSIYLTTNYGQDSSFAGRATPQGNTDENGLGDFYFAPPSGHLALNTANMPEPTILAPDEHFDTALYTGDNTARDITLSFQPDLTWIKARSSAFNSRLFDSARGAEVKLNSNTTSAEGTETGSLTSFNSTGFSLGTDASSGVNYTGTSYAAWNWKAGDSTSTGFQVIEQVLTTTGTNTIAHTLGVAPSMIIGKRTDAAETWLIYHEDGTTNSQYLQFTTAAVASSANLWGSSGPDASNIYFNGTAGRTYVFYLFCNSPVCNTGKYTGNGSTNGPVVYTGFRPAFLLIKSTSSTGWTIVDSKRDIDNVANADLFPHSSAAEDSSTNYVAADFLANGFKLRTSNSASNTSSQTYVYLAFAESPFKYANAR